MKRNYIKEAGMTLILSGFCLTLAAQSANQNYIRTRTYTGSNTSLERIEYYDGLGRLKQTVEKGITPGRADLVFQQDYDAFGRESYNWLPGKVDGNNGAFFNGDIVSRVKATNGGDEKPFSIPTYEASPLNRVIKQNGPGNDWYVNDRAIKTAYLSNTPGGNLSCGKYTLSGETITRSSVYPAGSLYVTQRIDEDNNVSYEFRDKLGRVVLQRQIADAGQHDTYYLYDDFGNLCCVIPPLAAEGMTSGSFYFHSPVLEDYGYLYRYDGRNRCKAKKLPGAGWVYMVYDKTDRLVLAQDAEQRKSNEWTFYKYDRPGRLVMQGRYTTTLSFESLSTQFNSIAIVTDYGTGDYGYSHVLPSVTADRVDLVNYYDSYHYLTQYGFPAVLGYETRSGYGQQHSSAKGLLTGVRSMLSDRSDEIMTSYYYDAEGQVVQERVSRPNSGQYDKHYIAYNYDGTVDQKLLEHRGPNSTLITEYYKYTYDHAGRLKQTAYSLNNATPVIMAGYTYDDLGRVSRKDQAGIASQHSYAYNVRGWTSLVSGNRLSQRLRYNEETGGYYGGNIRSMDYQVTGENAKGYRYSYDALGRLTGAVYGEGSDLSANRNRFNEHAQYDKQGNIARLQRYGLKNNGQYDLVDNLEYGYTGNLLENVTDYAGSQNRNDLLEFQYAPWFNKYGYDGNGRLSYDGNKSICSIEYNSLHLPRRIQHQEGHVCEYVYDASGVKCKVRYHTVNRNMALGWTEKRELSQPDILSTLETEYTGNKIYENGALKMILTEEGYVTRENGTYRHHYYIRDYLGNNRLVVDGSGNTVQKNYYYPFGLPNTYGTAQEKQPYKFNGKELDRMMGMNWYDYSARFYDGAIGRFTTQDPLAEKYYSISPYAYCLNNPVKFVDPNGEDVKIYYQDENGKNRAWIFNGSNQNQAPKNQFVSDFVMAYDYNVKNGGGDQMKAAATATDYTLNLVQTENGTSFQTTFNGPRTEGTVFWNPTDGLETPKGILSPATVLEHEMDHGVDWQTNTAEHIKNQKSPDSHFENKEEKRVITGSEYKTAVANGEIKAVPKGKENISSSYRGHVVGSGNKSVVTISPISNKKRQ